MHPPIHTALDNEIPDHFTPVDATVTATTQPPLTTGRWLVRRDPSSGQWAVHAPTRGLQARFSTHARALAYADRRARTVTVTLPRIPRPQRDPMTGQAREVLLRYTDTEGSSDLNLYGDGDVLISERTTDADGTTRFTDIVSLGAVWLPHLAGTLLSHILHTPTTDVTPATATVHVDAGTRK